MHSEQRAHPRVETENLTAHITLVRPPDKELVMQGKVLDLSYSGIKIKLNSPLQAEVNDKVSIKLQLPKSGIPINIHGTIKHCQSQSECGLHFIQQLPKQAMDDLIFECVLRSS